MTLQPSTADRLDELVVRVLAPNPSPMTLEGTNTYLIAASGGGGAIVVDPGPDVDVHREAIEAALRAQDAEVAAVVVTHHHVDHAEAGSWARRWRAELRAFAPDLLRDDAAELPAGGRLVAGGVEVEAVHTPGHSRDHLCLRVAPTGVVLTGDHVLGRGTTVVAYPDGDMADYLASLRRLRELDAPRLYPGHGPVVDDPRAVVDGYLAHREDREAQILAAVEAGAADPASVVATVYTDVPVALHRAAEYSVRAHLRKLVDEGRAPPSVLRGEPAPLHAPADPSTLGDAPGDEAREATP